MFSLILHEIDFYLNFILSLFLQSLFRISNLCQEKRFLFIHENNKIKNYKKKLLLNSAADEKGTSSDCYYYLKKV